MLHRINNFPKSISSTNGGIKTIIPCLRKTMTNTEKIVIKSEQLLKKELDIVEILRKIQQIEKLKQIMFDEKQRKLFNFISKPGIILSQEGKNERMKYHFMMLI